MAGKLKSNIRVIELVVLFFMFIYMMMDVYNAHSFKKEIMELEEKNHRERLSAKKQSIEKQNQILNLKNQIIKQQQQVIERLKKDNKK